MPPGNFAFLTPSVTPRPQNRPRKKGKLTPGKNPSTTGSAGRSDPARDACGRPRAFHLLFFHTSHHWLVFGETARLMGGQKLAQPPSTLAAAFRGGLFSFFSAKLGSVWPKPAPDRAGTGRSPTWGGNRHTGPPGAKSGAWAVLWDGWLWGPVPEGTQGTQNSARGEGAKFASLARAFPRVQGGNAHQCTLQLTHNM